MPAKARYPKPAPALFKTWRRETPLAMTAVFVCAYDILNQQAARGVAGDHGRPPIAALQQAISVVDTQTSLGVGAGGMAIITVVDQERPYLFLEEHNGFGVEPTIGPGRPGGDERHRSRHQQHPEERHLNNYPSFESSCVGSGKGTIDGEIGRGWPHRATELVRIAGDHFALGDRAQGQMACWLVEFLRKCTEPSHISTFAPPGCQLVIG